MSHSAMHACPYRQYEGFLGADMAGELLAYAASRELAYTSSRIGSGPAARHDLSRRISSICTELGDWRERLQARILPSIPEFTEAVGLYPFAVDRLEIELAAHGDGAFFCAHADTRRDVLGAPSPRVLSVVYYFHSRPARFDGGSLRLYDIGEQASGAYADIRPLHDSLVVFPSCAIHEVMPVSAPGIAFADRRFALNIWVHKAL